MLRENIFLLLGKIVVNVSSVYIMGQKTTLWLKYFCINNNDKLNKQNTAGENS